MKIKYKLMISYFVLIFFSVSILGFLLAQKANDTVLKKVNEKSKSLTESISTTLSVRNESLSEKSYGDLNFANTLLNNFKDLKVDYNERIKVGVFDLPVLYLGNQKLSLDDTIPDKLKQSTGTVATIFLLYDNKLIRVSSTIFKEDKSVIGTYISSDSESYKKIVNNEEYSGDIAIEGKGYITRMQPLLDKDKKVIGAIGIGNKILNKYFIVRISWVFGVNGNNFIKTMLRLGKEKESLNVVCDQIGSPTYTADLAPLLCDMAVSEKYGVYHATNEGFCSWAEFATEIMKKANLNCKVNPISTSEYPTKAVRPFNSKMSKSSLVKNGFELLPRWENALERYLAEIRG